MMIFHLHQEFLHLHVIASLEAVKPPPWLQHGAFAAASTDGTGETASRRARACQKQVP